MGDRKHLTTVTRTSEAPPQDWNSFEEAVAQVFRLRGYDVRRDSLLGGRQTDLLLRSPLEPFGQVLVECKFHEKQRKVGVEDVEAFAARAVRLRTNGDISAGYLVTNSDFTARALNLLQSHPEHRFILLRTLDQLRRQLIDFTGYLERFVAEYRSNNEDQLYEPLLAQRAEGRGRLIPCDTALLSFVNSHRTSLFVLTADYGMGKTTTLRHLAFELALRALNTGSGRIPIFIPLKWYGQSGGAIGLIQRFLQSNGLSHNSIDSFLAMHGQGQFCLLLDGFDEMARRTTSQIRIESLGDLLELATPSSKVVLSGRPGYFPDDRELRIAMRRTDAGDTRSRIRDAVRGLSGKTKTQSNRTSFRHLQLKFLSPKQIKSFVERRCGSATARKIISYIHKTYNLADLARRPILLEMIGETFRSANAHDIATPGDMYQSYTNIWLEIDEEKGFFRRLITREDRLAFSMGLAATFQRSGIFTIHWTELQPLVRNYFNLKEADDIDHFSGDIRTCTFLNRDDAGYYQFVHQSFQEYFLARFLVLSDQRLWESFASGAWIDAAFRNLPGAVRGFVSDVAGVPFDRGYWNDLQDLLANAADDITLSENCEQLFASSVELLINSRTTVENIHDYAGDVRSAFDCLKTTLPLKRPVKNPRLKNLHAHLHRPFWMSFRPDS